MSGEYSSSLEVVVMNDGAYGSEIHKLRSEGLSETGAAFGFADLAGIARGFGLHGQTITDVSQIPAALEELEHIEGPALWDLRVSDKVISRITRQAHPQRS